MENENETVFKLNFLHGADIHPSADDGADNSSPMEN